MKLFLKWVGLSVATVMATGVAFVEAKALYMGVPAAFIGLVHGLTGTATTLGG